MTSSFRHRSGHQLPYLWQHFLPEDFQYMQLPAESKANCASCPQIACAGFREDYRCCTYLPRIANFQLALLVDTAAGEAQLKNLIERRLVTPEGLMASPDSWYLSARQNHRDLFGRGDDMLCPLLDVENQRCSAHGIRNSTCASYFCEKDQGRSGEEFWDHLENLVNQIEGGLALWFLQQLGFDHDGYFAELETIAKQWQPNPKLGRGPIGWHEAQFRALWGSAAGCEMDFFRQIRALLAENLHELAALARAIKVFPSSSYERIVQDKIEQVMPGAVAAEEKTQLGEAESIASLWYEFTAQHKNLWQVDLDTKFRQNPYIQLTDKEELPQAIAQGLGRHRQVLLPKDQQELKLRNVTAISAAEQALWEQFANPTQIKDLNFAALAIDPQPGMVTLATWLRRKLLVPADHQVFA